MARAPFLLRFRHLLSSSDYDVSKGDETLYYSIDQQVNLTETGSIAWSSLSQKYPTAAYTKGRVLKGGWTRGKIPKYKPSRSTPGKMDRRAGK